MSAFLAIIAAAVLPFADGHPDPERVGDRVAVPPDDRAVLDCDVPSEADADEDLFLVCAHLPGVGITKATLYFRSRGRFAYVGQVMRPAGERRWRGAIPRHMLEGDWVQIYIEATDRRRRPVTTWNTHDSPQIVRLQRTSQGSSRRSWPSDQESSPAFASPDSDGAAVAVVEENPFDLPATRPPSAVPYRHRRGWIALGMGDGVGWSFQQGPRPTGTAAPALDIHLAPELGYHLSPRIAVALAGRLQFIQQPPRDDRAAKSAYLGFLRLIAFSHVGRHRLFVAGTLGAGGGFRLVFPAVDDSRGRQTIRGGPFAAGASVGYVGDLSRSRLALTVELAGLGAFPDSAIVVDLRIGLAAFF